MLGDFPEAAQGAIAEDTTMFEGVSTLESILGLGQLRPMRNAEDGLFLKSMMPLNTVMFRGHTKRAKDSDPNKRTDFKVTQGGRGHWGANVSLHRLLVNVYVCAFSPRFSLSLHEHLQIYAGVAAHRTGLSGDGFIQQIGNKQDDLV